MNLNFEEMPSKTQIFGKEQTRIKYFKALINDILRYAASYGGVNSDVPATGGKAGQQSIRVKLLKVLYNLLLIDAVPIKLLTNEKEGGTKQPEMSERRSSLTNDYVDISYDPWGGNDESKDNGGTGEVFLGYMDEDESQIKSRFGNTEKGLERPIIGGRLGVINEGVAVQEEDAALKAKLP